MSLQGSEVDALLSMLCTKLGFCLPLTDQAQLKANPPSNPEDFTNAVFLAEGLDPDTAHRDLYQGDAILEYVPLRGVALTLIPEPRAAAGAR